MTQWTLVKPIDNIESADEAMVMGIIHHLIPALDAWRGGEDLRAEIEANKQAQPGLQARVDRARSAQRAASQALQNAKPLTFNKASIWQMASAWLAGGLTGYFVGLVAASAMTLILSGWSLSTARRAANAIKNSLSEDLAVADKLLASADTDCQQQQQSLLELQQLLQSREFGFPALKVTPIDFVLRTAEVAGQQVLLDLSESHPSVRLKGVDVSGVEAGLAQIADKVQALLTVPPLLTPAEHAQSDDPIHELFGEENDLQQLVGEFTLTLGKLRDIQLNLPLVPNSSLLLQRAAHPMRPSEGAAPSVRISSQLDSKVIGEFMDQINQNRDRGLAVFEELNDVFDKLNRVCALYAQARISSVNTLHANLLDVLGSASWCGRRMYCPRTIQSSVYMEDMLGLKASKAYLLSYEDLLDRLCLDLEIDKRLKAKPDLKDQLAQSHDAVQQFMEGAQFSEDGHRLDVGQRPRHIEVQFDAAVKHFCHLLQQVMTGAAYPVLNFSTSAQLFYDPDNQEWASNVAPYTYSTADAIRYGSVVKAYSDLMIPLWEHLWTEKADFRKSELFRTNEEMRRMTEKESEKLIDIANQFRADMRSVRENVYMLESDLKSKCAEILSFRDSMGALGLMSKRATDAVSDQQMERLVVGNSTLGMADRYETILSSMPHTQAANRGSVNDPIDLIREPDALVPHASEQPSRLLDQ